MNRLPIVWDMETNDPDDFLTLLLLLGHPRVELKAVTIWPGTAEQVGLVRWAMAQFGVDLPVGFNDHEARNYETSKWHRAAYGVVAPSHDAVPAEDVLRFALQPGVTMVTGGPLTNLSLVLGDPDFLLDRLVVQGGFAGAGVVPLLEQLPKFRGFRTCPTYNLNVDPGAAHAVLGHPRIKDRRFVSKNVCHGVVYDARFHAKVGAAKAGRTHLELIWLGMECYLRRREGKKLHDPLAACCAIDEGIASWAEVELFEEQGQPWNEWGSKPAQGTSTHIIVRHDQGRFEQVFLA